MMEVERWVKCTPLRDTLVCSWGFIIIKRILLDSKIQGTKDANLNEAA